MLGTSLCLLHEGVGNPYGSKTRQEGVDVSATVTSKEEEQALHCGGIPKWDLFTLFVFLQLPLKAVEMNLHN